MSRIEKNHEIVGKTLSELGDLNIGTLYPVIDDSQKIIGVYSAEFGTPDGYYLDYTLQAYVEIRDNLADAIKSARERFLDAQSAENLGADLYVRRDSETKLWKIAFVDDRGNAWDGAPFSPSNSYVLWSSGDDTAKIFDGDQTAIEKLKSALDYDWDSELDD